MRRLVLIAMVLLVTASAAGAGWMMHWLDRPLPVPAGGHVLEIRPGQSLSSVTQDLATARVMDHPRIFLLWARSRGAATRIHAGEYRLDPGIDPRRLVDMLVTGRVVMHSLTLLEGWTVRDIRAALASAPGLVQTLTSRDPAALAGELGIDYPSAEGAFFPDTYRFPRGTTDRQLLLMAHAALRTHLAQAWAMREQQDVLQSPYELLILASIIEKETGLATERAMISGVFTRRLRRGMRLQTDPSVIYGLGDDFSGPLSRADLVAETPWNTYTRDGLPPTPIAAPGREALLAAARPAGGSALYFVASGSGDGSHVFSDTLAEHNRAVRAWRQRRVPNHASGEIREP